MKLHLNYSLAIISLLIAGDTQAEMLQRASIPANSKWVLHLDVDALRDSEIGAGLMTGIVLEQAQAIQKKVNLDVPTIIENTHSITVYGADYQSGSEGKGILLWKGEGEMEQIANAFLIQQVEATKAGEGNVTSIQTKPFPLYNMDDDMFAAVVSGKGLILGRSEEQIRTAAKVFDGDVQSMAQTESFTEFPPLSGGFFLVAYAESFSESADMPPQARVLKLADGGRIAMGEDNQNLIIQLILRARSEEVTQQIQQVIQGLLALATLGLGEEPGIQKIIRATQVNVAGRQVKLDLIVPLEEAVKHIEKTSSDSTDSE